MVCMEPNAQAEFKNKLEVELERVEGELRDLGWENIQGEWETDGGDIDSTATEEDEIADRIEELEERGGEMDALKVHYKNIKRALEKIENGEYGVCEVGGEDIELDRLEASPSARTCKMHIESEGELD